MHLPGDPGNSAIPMPEQTGSPARLMVLANSPRLRDFHAFGVKIMRLGIMRMATRSLGTPDSALSPENSHLSGPLISTEASAGEKWEETRANRFNGLPACAEAVETASAPRLPRITKASGLMRGNSQLPSPIFTCSGLPR